MSPRTEAIVPMVSSTSVVLVSIRAEFVKAFQMVRSGCLPRSLFKLRSIE